MATAPDGPRDASRLLFAADAFLFAAAFTILGSLVLIGLNSLTGALDQDTTQATAAALAIQGGSLLLSLLAAGGGAVLAWRLHGRALTWQVSAAMVVGVVVGTPIAFAAFGGFMFLTSRIPLRAEGPPWIAIGALATLVVALLAMPVVDTVRDTRGPRTHLRLDSLRLIALAVVVAIAVVALPVAGAIAGNELGEAGLFMLPFSLAGALAALGGDVYCRYRDRHAMGATRTA